MAADGGDPLKGLSKAQLQAVARDMDVRVKSKMPAKDLRAAIALQQVERTRRAGQIVTADGFLTVKTD